MATRAGSRIVHEHHVVEALVKEIITRSNANHASKITKVTLVMGPACGFRESSVRLYFEEFSKGTVLQGADLVIRPVAGEGHGTEFYVDSVEIETDHKV